MSELPAAQPAPESGATPVKQSIEDRISASLAPEGEPPPQAAPEPAREPVSEPEPAPSPEPDAEPVRADADPDGAPAEPVEAPEETAEVSSLAELAQHYDADVADLYPLTVTVSAGGVSEDVTIGQLKDAYGASKNTVKLQETLKKERESLASEAAATKAQHEAQLLAVAEMAQNLDRWALAEYEGVDWNALSAENPAVFAAERQKFQERRAEVEKTKATAGQRLQQYQQQLAAQQQQQLATHLEAQQKRLLTLVPEMADPQKSEAERSALVDYLPRAGLSSQEIEAVSHHAAILALARKARLYDEGQAKIEPAKKRVLKIAKRTLSPGAAQGKGAVANEQKQAVRSRLRKTGKVDDAVAAIQNLLGR